MDSAEDILRYLEFAQEMAPHATSKQESFNIPQYTGQDVYDFFIKPQEVARMESARAGIASGLDRGRRLAAAEGGKMASSIAGSAPSAYGATSQRALASRGGPFAERALVEGLKGIANTVTSDPTRTAPISRLGQLASTGHGIHRDLNLGIADAFSALGGAGGDTGGLCFQSFFYSIFPSKTDISLSPHSVPNNRYLGGYFTSPTQLLLK